MISRCFFSLAAFILTLTTSVWAGETEPIKPRIAVWDPVFGTRETFFKIDLEALNQTAAWLQESGAQVSRLKIDGLSDPTLLTTQNFDALWMPGDAFPRSAAPAILKFVQSGGVLVALNARVPFGVAIAPEPNGTWAPNPKKPALAWKSDEISSKVLGLSIIENPLDDAPPVANQATPLFKKYLPDAPNFDTKMPSGQFVPAQLDGTATEFYPLIRSLRADGRDAIPQLTITKNGPRLGILATHDWLTNPTNPELWPLAKETVIALAQISADLKSGQLKLSDADKIEISENQSPVKMPDNRGPQK